MPAPTAISTAIINLLGNYSAPLTAAQEKAVLDALNATFANFTGITVSIANVQACTLLYSYPAALLLLHKYMAREGHSHKHTLSVYLLLRQA